MTFAIIFGVLVIAWIAYGTIMCINNPFTLNTGNFTLLGWIVFGPGWCLLNGGMYVVFVVPEKLGEYIRKP